MYPSPTVIVYGNIATGKSSLCERLCAANPHLLLVSMDRLRAQEEQHGGHANPMSRDRVAERKLLELAETNGPLLYETSAATDLYLRMRRVIIGRRRGQVVMLQTTCSKRTALERAEQRRASGHLQYRPAAQGRMPMAAMWDHFAERMPAHADLVLDTERHNAAECARMAETYLAGHCPWWPQPATRP